ncbi:MAG: tpn50 [Bacteroidetes bacterium]|nr:MAG: tpn50 [Bacteroidota bacterium]
MKTTTRLFAFISLFLFAAPVFAKKNEVKKKWSQAELAFAAEDYEKALSLYLEVLDKQPDNNNVRFKIGVCYLNSASDKTKAESFLEPASRAVSEKYRETSFKEKQAPPQVWLYLGQSYHFNYKFDESIAAFEKFKTYIGQSDSAMTASLDRSIKMCRHGKEYTASPINIKVENAGTGINTPYADYSPVISVDESVLIFTSRRPSTTGGKIDPEDGKYFEDVYISTRNGDTWSAAQNIGTAINSSGHEATIGLSADGQQLFIYKDDNGDGNIYVSTLNGKDWSPPVKITDNVNGKSWEPSASVSPDGNTLYFTSNREGGFGGRDIYRSVKLPNGQWSKAINLGPAVNTAFDEDAPSMQADGVTLYFSSNGHSTMGGFDIFFSTYSEEGGWSAPVNVGYPVNTTDDDVFYVPTADNKHAYYSSFKNSGGQGEKDIYLLTFPDRAETPVTVYSGEITSIYGGVPEDAEITVTNVLTGDIVGTFKPNTSTGKFVMILQSGQNYAITYQATNYLYQSDNFNVSDTTAYMTINRPIVLEPIKVGQKIVVRNIFFATGKSELQPESKTELAALIQLMKTFDKLVVEVSGHSDARGGDELNQKLSEKRAQAVVSYLISSGISKDRMRAVGMGESKPIAINYNPNGTANVQGMSLNRRFEFTILSVTGEPIKDVVQKIDVPDPLKNKDDKK